MSYNLINEKLNNGKLIIYVKHVKKVDQYMERSKIEKNREKAGEI